MLNVTLSEFSTLVEAQATACKQGDYIMVMLGAVECSYCEIMKPIVVGMEPWLNEHGIKLYYLEITGVPPLFAPMALPSLVCFDRGGRAWEGLGFMEKPEVIQDSLNRYLLNGAGDSRTLWGT